MRIESSDVHMNTFHEHIEKEEERHAFALQLLNADGKPIDFPEPAKEDVEAESEESEDGSFFDFKSMFGSTQWGVAFLIQIITGHRDDEGGSPLVDFFKSMKEAPPTLPEIPRQIEWSAKTTTSYYEHENMRYHAQGQVTTKDGRTIDIAHKLDLTREFQTQSETYVKETRPIIDPLVVNFNNDSVKLDEKRMAFDLDMDGELDNINFVQAGSGYLALDKNQDGIINNGSELFGPQSGDGFADLAQYDDDNNGWIDEADEVFDDLSLWVQDDNGDKSLVGLQEVNIGAIGLKNAKTEFSLTDENNVANAYIGATGIALTEDGDVKTVQQIDLTV